MPRFAILHTLGICGCQVDVQSCVCVCVCVCPVSTPVLLPDGRELLGVLNNGIKFEESSRECEGGWRQAAQQHWQ